jgi:hypothetical protein
LYSKHSIEIALHSNAREILSSHFNKRDKQLRIVYIKVVSTVCSNMRTIYVKHYDFEETRHASEKSLASEK